MLVGIRPQMAVGVQSLERRLMAEPGLHGPDARAIADEKAGVEVPQDVERDVVWQTCGASSLAEPSELWPFASPFEVERSLRDLIRGAERKESRST